MHHDPVHTYARSASVPVSDTLGTTLHAGVPVSSLISCPLRDTHTLQVCLPPVRVGLHTRVLPRTCARPAVAIPTPSGCLALLPPHLPSPLPW